MCPAGGATHFEDQVVNVHLLLLLDDVYNQAVDDVPLSLQCAGCFLVHIQVCLLWQQLHLSWNSPLAEGGHLLVQCQHTCMQKGMFQEEDEGG